MIDQLKAIWKPLLCIFFSSSSFAQDLSTAADPPAFKAARIHQTDSHQQLQTPVAHYQRNEQSLSLIGVVHIADAAYYQALNTLFSSYDAVFYEMIASPQTVARLKSGAQQPQPQPDPAPQAPLKKNAPQKSSVSGLNNGYNLFKNMLALESQSQWINYSAPNFIHADMTLNQFEREMQKRNTTVMNEAVSNLDVFSQIDQAVVMRAMLTGDPTTLKANLMTVLAASAAPRDENQPETILIHLRNEECLRIVSEHLQHQAPKKSAIFYGAAHLPDFHHRLTQDGWTLSETEWMNAWSIEQPAE